jgi:hypothetical protein
LNKWLIRVAVEQWTVKPYSLGIKISGGNWFISTF